MARFNGEYKNEYAMQLMGDVIGEAARCGYVDEADLYGMDEPSLIARFEECADMDGDSRFARLFRTFRSMTEVIRSDRELEGCYCVSFDVKRRYVDPLVRVLEGNAGGAEEGGAAPERLSRLNGEAARLIGDFLAFNDSPWSCVRYAC